MNLYTVAVNFHATLTLLNFFQNFYHRIVKIIRLNIDCVMLVLYVVSSGAYLLVAATDIAECTCLVRREA